MPDRARLPRPQAMRRGTVGVTIFYRPNSEAVPRKTSPSQVARYLHPGPWAAKFAYWPGHSTASKFQAGRPGASIRTVRFLKAKENTVAGTREVRRAVRHSFSGAFRFALPPPKGSLRIIVRRPPAAMARQFGRTGERALDRSGTDGGDQCKPGFPPTQTACWHHRIKLSQSSWRHHNTFSPALILGH